ncbi:hypothetical protein BDW59DRAFT_149017 [Aspergillus cavernicola]|uniref:Uncharacterized protein n=1 Tax=Aspergillus cavernicola TaxID=176166 RepID=A0ABR4I5X3_9EURO
MTRHRIKFTPTLKTATAMTINIEDLAVCRRDRDFTNLLDIKNTHHSAFIKRLRDLGEYYTWAELRESDSARSICVDQFLDLFGMEYWGIQKNREKYLMPDSMERGDAVTYPGDKPEIEKTLILLLKRKAETMMKQLKEEAPESAQRATQKRAAPEDMDYTLDEKQAEDAKNADEAATITIAETAEATENKVTEALPAAEPKETNPKTTRYSKRRMLAEARERECKRAPSSTRSSISSSSLTSLFSPRTIAPGPVAPERSPTSAPSLVDASLINALRTKYGRDTYFLVTTDTEPKISPAWVKYQHITSASSFLMKMGRERDLEEEWWTPNAQMNIESAVSDELLDFVTVAQDVIAMASVNFEWTGEEVLVRWGNDSDWEVVVRLIEKAWIAREFAFGVSGVEIFKIRVVLHLEY